uniref:Uncharacterized protein n=1 Tax=Megaselia scalaris TaxID=36166 RepID=T1GJ44_MEGSC
QFAQPIVELIFFEFVACFRWSVHTNVVVKHPTQSDIAYTVVDGTPVDDLTSKIIPNNESASIHTIGGVTAEVDVRSLLSLLLLFQSMSLDGLGGNLCEGPFFSLLLFVVCCRLQEYTYISI